MHLLNRFISTFKIKLNADLQVYAPFSYKYKE